MRVNIKRNQEFFASLNSKLREPICSKNIENHLPWIVFMRLQYKRSSFPFTTRRNATTLRQYCNNFSL